MLRISSVATFSTIAYRADLPFSIIFGMFHQGCSSGFVGYSINLEEGPLIGRECAVDTLTSDYFEAMGRNRSTCKLSKEKLLELRLRDAADSDLSIHA